MKLHLTDCLKATGIVLLIVEMFNYYIFEELWLSLKISTVIAFAFLLLGIAAELSGLAELVERWLDREA